VRSFGPIARLPGFRETPAELGYALTMIPLEKVKELVEAHTKLDEPMTAAIWIRKDESEVWLVEVIPIMAEDENAGEPTHFNPGVSFRFPLALIAGNRQSLEAAIRRDRTLARYVVDGSVMYDVGGEAEALIATAREVSQAA
jgi:hypothetical protein